MLYYIINITVLNKIIALLTTIIGEPLNIFNYLTW